MNEKIYYKSPIGLIEIICCHKKQAITNLNFTDKKYSETVNISSAIGRSCVQQLEEYFNGKCHNFSLELAPSGTDMQQHVWQELCNIPYAQTSSYKDIATNIGRKNAYRAVGNANGKNPIAIIIPCHRVIASNGDIAGYAYGIERKKFLLELEATKI